MAREIFQIENGSMGFATVDPGKAVDVATIGDYTAFNCQFLSGQVTATSKVRRETTEAGFCDPETEAVFPQPSAFDLAISLFQDPHKSAGLSQFLYAHDGEWIWFFLGLDSVEGAPKAIGKIVCQAGPVGGAARTTLKGSVTFPCDGKPQVLFGLTADGVPTPA